VLINKPKGISVSNPLPLNAVVWAELPVSDLEKSMAFYTAVLGNPLVANNDGPNPMADLPCKDYMSGVAGHIYPGKPAEAGAGPTIHLALPDAVEDAMKRVEAAGGKVVSPVIEIPAGRFAYCTDPDGNSIGIFQR
jgi:predicted enzyme related to lactoylglutathione lyase